MEIRHFYQQILFYLLTLFELDPDPGIILNLLYHLAVPADDDADSKSGHNHLNNDGVKYSEQIRKILTLIKKITLSLLSSIWKEEKVLTSRLLPPILDPKSALPVLKSPWSLSRMSFTTSSRACYKEDWKTPILAIMVHRKCRWKVQLKFSIKTKTFSNVWKEDWRHKMCKIECKLQR